MYRIHFCLLMKSYSMNNRSEESTLVAAFVISETQRKSMQTIWKLSPSPHRVKAVWELWNTTERWHTVLHWPSCNSNCTLQQPAVLGAGELSPWMLYVWVCCSWSYQTKGCRDFEKALRPLQLSLKERAAHWSSHHASSCSFRWSQVVCELCVPCWMEAGQLWNVK